nr:Ig-like domain-containing protein [Ornithinimicrobium sp. HY1793]
MQYGDIGTVYDGSPDCSANECDPGAWEIAVPNGLYEVTVAVGDQPSSSTYDSLHALNVEGGVIIREFQANSAQEFLEATAHAGVTDGKLTVTAVGGANTKISYVQIRSLGAQPHATLTVPANRATDVSLDTAVSASVSVPGTGIAVDPDRQTSLTDEAVRLFKVTATGDVEVEGNRGSTGGNDTIAISPAAPLEPNSTYRYVIDGVLDGAGQSFAPFETTFTTGEGSGGDPGDPEEFVPVEGAEFEKVLLPTASGNTNGKYFASLVVHEGYLWATTIGQGMYRYEILPDGTLGAAENLNVLNGRAAVGLLFDENNPDLAWVTHATGNIGNESAKFGSTLSVIDFSGATPVVTDVFVNLPRSKSDHLSNSISYGPSGDGGAPWLYFLQGSNQAAGDVDGAWGARGETQLTAAVLRFDPQDALAQALADGPTDVKTAELGGAYDPYADGAPLEIYATGIRNAYDLLWHSNGHIYVPTNGTAGGANAPGVQDNGDGTFTMVSNQATGENGYGNGTDVTEECTTRRIDGQPYSGGSVPPIGNLPTQRDFLFDVEQGGFYGHPNPTRCEWVLNDGTAYNPDREPDPNYHGVAFDFDFNKSPNGVIEYTSNTFGGALQGRMMVIRFSANDDILTFQVAGDGEVLGTQPGTDIPGFTGYVDPLDLVEDTEVNPGNIYINQYNRGGEPQQLYLLRVPEGEQAAGIRADQDELIMSATLNGDDPTETREVTVTNLGSEPVEVSASVEGANAGDFTVDSGLTIPGGEASQIEVTFDPSGSAGIRTGSLVLGDGEGSVNVSLRALAFAGHQGGNEPTLQQVVDTFQFGISTGWSGLAGGTEPVAKGDEVLEPLFQRASDGPVTMTPVAAFAPQEDLPFGWYAAAEGPVTPTQVGVVANGQLQTLNPQLDSGGTSFDPGTGAFGVFYESNTFNRIGYTEDARNDSGGLHRARIYPLTGDRFLVAFEDAANGDYQDYVFVLDNVVAAGDGSEPPVTGETISVNFGTGDSALPQGYLRDFGEAYAERTAADQGGLSYGWVDAGSEPLSIIGNGRDRNLNDDQRLDTLVHMDLPEDASGGISGEATWEIALPDGDYEVTVSVGDAQDGGSPEAHTINVEGSNAIDAFPKSSAPNGSDDRHESATVTVEVTDGRLTVDQAGGENTKINYLDITPLLDEEPEPPAEGDPIKVNFQLETAPVPDGYLRDFGEPYAERAGVSQGEGLTFGWVDDQLLEPLDLVGNGRDRNLNDDQRLDTLMHMDLPEDSDGGVLSDGAWQIAVPNGQFEVTVSVGDPSKGDAPESHTINVEGVNAIEAFPNSSAANGSDARHTEGTVVVEVLDGALTVDQIGGINTKINYIDIVPMSSGTPVEQVVAQVNFQPAASVTPQGWLADTGQLFDGERGYGWVRTEGGADKAADTRERAGAADQADKTLVIMDDNQVPGVVDGEWEYALRNGEYQVEVSVGDPGYIDSVHGVEAEGVVVVDAFEPSALGDYYVGEATLEVTDGALTLASTGHNTKVQWVRITSFATGDVVPPQLSLAVDGQGDDGAYTGPVTVTVTATDRTLEFVNVTVDGSDTFNYTTPFEVTGTGNHTVEVTATDGAGNATTRSVEFVIVEVGEGDLTLTNPEAAPFHDRIVMSRIQSTASNPATASTGSVILGNEGSESIEVVALDIMDQSAFTLVDPPELPIAIGVGDTVSVSVEFIGTGSGQNTNFESALLIRHNGSEGPTTKVELGAIWQSQSEGGNEPDVDEIVEAFGFGTTIVGAGQQINNDGRLEAIGDEVLSATWKRFDTSEPVTVRQLAAFHTCCSNTASFGWHPVGNKNNWNVALTHQGQWAQSLLPRINGSSGGPAVNSFTPGPATWSWRIDPESSDWTLNNTTPDECGSGNEGCQLGHHLRLWPVKDRAGDAIPGSYLAAMDYSGINYDYNDNVYLLTNVEPANLVQP